MSRWDVIAAAFPVPAVPRGVWTQVMDFVEGGTILKIEARIDQTWRYATDRRCGADGDPAALIARAKCVCPTAPVGALIGKIGGSTAAAADGTVFVVGSQCVVKAPVDGGPLYLTINDQETGMDAESNDGTLDVAVQRRLD